MRESWPFGWLSCWSGMRMTPWIRWQSQDPYTSKSRFSDETKGKAGPSLGLLPLCNCPSPGLRSSFNNFGAQCLHRGVGTSFLLQSGMQIPITWKHDSILSHQSLDLHSSHFWALSFFLQRYVLHI
ncbi:hypothetical protein FA13DRAFT_1737062 [Coprinellus micaceus]|uniref:Uncharacterized protein n=1 Tax=Coprinellus micaceus TaxID=71717 RepID=A0A4Y7SZ00_COPMI|nr:hypothetical protein FA13DRAFT_1737062 [Coprinellus micaceus]